MDNPHNKNDKKQKSNLGNYGWVIAAVGLVGASVVLQLVTGALRATAVDLVGVLVSVMVAVFLIWWVKLRHGRPVTDERLKSVFARANSITLFIVIIGSVVGANVALAFTPTYPELKIVSTTLLGMMVTVGILRYIFYLWYDRRMS